MPSKIAPPADLHALLEGVHDEQTFAGFLRALAVDFETDRSISDANPDAYKFSSGPLGWEYSTISDWLYTAAHVAELRPRLLAIPDNPWKRCAQILLIAKIYE